MYTKKTAEQIHQKELHEVHLHGLSAIATETEQLQNEIEGHRSVLNYLLRSVRTMDPIKKEACIHPT